MSNLALKPTYFGINTRFSLEIPISLCGHYETEHGSAVEQEWGVGVGRFWTFGMEQDFYKAVSIDLWPRDVNQKVNLWSKVKHVYSIISRAAFHLWSPWDYIVSLYQLYSLYLKYL